MATIVMAAQQGKVVFSMASLDEIQVDVSVIIPTLNESAVINKTLERLQCIREKKLEIIIADGGSTDKTLNHAAALVDQVISSPKGRSTQMNAGANIANGEWLLFLHADTQLPDDFSEWLLQLKNSDSRWGFFPIQFDGSHWFYRCLARAMNWRSRLTQVATGDQCLFVRQSLFKQIGGFSDIPLMEDVAITKKLRAIDKAMIGQSAVISASRRWEQHGKIKTVLLMWWLRLAYFFGVNPAVLYRFYYE